MMKICFKYTLKMSTFSFNDGCGIVINRAHKFGKAIQGS